MSTTATTEVPGLVAGTWAIDPTHSNVSFTVRHMMVSKVRGHFGEFSGAITVADDLLDSSVEATVQVASFDTNNADRDNHIRSADFLEVETHPTLTYRSTGLRRRGDDFVVDGELTLHGVTRAVELALEFGGVTTDPWGNQRAGFSAHAEINRRDFGIDIDMPLDGGGVVVGDKVKIDLDVEAVLQTTP